jgi:hypothetical protein
MITINMDKAKKIWRDKIAEARKAAFEKNDIAIRDAQLENDTMALTFALRRRDELRAIGDKINAAKTPDELKTTLAIINMV